MTSRFEIERAVLASDLSKTERLLVLVLLTHSDNATAEIEPRYTPSLSTLARESGLDRTTVQRMLTKLEKAGWVVRRRPAVEQSRRGQRTRYRLRVPGSEVGAQDTYLGAQDTQAGGTVHPGVGAQDRKPRGTAHPNHSCSTAQITTREETWSVIRALHERTGKRIDENHAEKVVQQLIGDRTDIRDRCGYLAAAIRKDADPHRFLPTPTPPRFQRDAS